jgi:hypothetical protein
MEYPILRTLEEKVRFFRDILLGTEMHSRIIVGLDPEKMEALQLAVDDVEMGPCLANSICVIGDDPDYFMPVKSPRDSKETIWIYSHLFLTDSLTDDLCEKEAATCEIVIFEPMGGA